MICRTKLQRVIARSALLVSIALSIPHFLQIACRAATKVGKGVQVKTAAQRALQVTSALLHLLTQSTALLAAIVAGKGVSIKAAAQRALQVTIAL